MADDVFNPRGEADATPRSRWRSRVLAPLRRPTWIAALSGIALTLVVGSIVAQWEQRVIRVEFDSAAAANAGSLTYGIDEYIRRLETLRTLFEASEEVTRSEFDVFSRRLFSGHSGLLRVAWMPRVRSHERRVFEDAARADGVPNYRIRSMAPPGRDEDAGRDFYPVYFSTEPKTSMVYGLDHSSDPGRMSTLDRARDLDRVAVHLAELQVSARPGAQGLLVTVPVFVKGTSRDTVRDRRRNINGFVVGVFDFVALIDSIRAKDRSVMSIQLVRHVMDRFGAPIDVVDYPAGGATIDSTAPLQWTGRLPIGDGVWTLVAAPRVPDRFGVRFTRTLALTAGGFFLTFLIVAYLTIAGRNQETLRRAHRRVLEVAQTDNLTGLANRAFFMQRLDMAARQVMAGGRHFNVFMIDIDHFKEINDTLGHGAGDGLLREAADRLKAGLRGHDLLARLGGDEFAILQPVGVEQDSEGALLAMKIIQLLTPSFTIQGRKVEIGASVGVAMAPEHGSDPQELLRNADVALYRSKADGRGCFTTFRKSMAEEIAARSSLEADLRSAIAAGQFQLYYQPIVDATSGVTCGAEALLRWHHPTRGMVPPQEFIPVAEETGLIIPLGEWVLRQACSDAVSWPHQLKVAVNISPAQFRDKDLFGVICGALFEAGLPPQRLEIEITESVLMDSAPDKMALMQELRDSGMSLALDDFGTGYSSLSYLTKFPFSKIKIDRSFVRNVTCDPQSEAIVSAIITLARRLGVTVTAEGIEREDQAELLRRCGADFLQGYLFGRPAAEPDFARVRSQIAPSSAAVA